MKAYRSSPWRLVRFFRESRDKWKARAAQYHRQVRALQVTVRDLKKSRDHWKTRAKEATHRPHQEESESSDTGASEDEPRKENADSLIREGQLSVPLTQEVKEGEYIPHDAVFSDVNEIAWQNPYGHVYPVFVIKLAIEQLINSFAGLRGCQHTLEAFARYFHFPVPSFTTIRYWLLRMGLHELLKPIENRSDWIILVDMTIALGKVKCLLVVGIPEARLPIVTVSRDGETRSTYALRHHDVELLALELMDHTTGEAVARCLETLSLKTGVVRQIVADRGSDIQKGIDIYQQKHSGTIYTHDVTHKMALLLQYELEDDERFQSFRARCTRTLREVQQTELHCLTPPKQRTKSRYHDIDTQAKWAQAILDYQEGGDFSEFGTEFEMDAATFDIAWRMLDPSSRRLICRMPWKTYPSRESFIRHVIIPLGENVSEQQRVRICQVADEGRRRFEGKLGWVIDYREEIDLYSRFMDIVKAAEKQIKHQGLNRNSATLFEKCFRDRTFLPRVQHFKDRVVDYLCEEGDKIPEGRTALGASDVLESLIGKLKVFLAKSPFREVGQIILSIPLFTIRIVDQIVKDAMESVQEMDVDDWARRTLGRSALAKRRALLGTNKRGAKVV